MRTTSALAFVAPIVIAACSAASSPGDTGGEGTGAGSGSGAPIKGGAVYVSSFDSGDGTGFASVSASFYDNSTIDAGDAGSSVAGCQRTDAGSCFLLLCASSSGGPIGSIPTPPTAGTIQVSSASGTSVSLVPAADGTYMAKTGMTTFWSAGDTVSVEASGAEVPAFSVSVPAPSSIAITAPIDAPTITVDASADLAFAWTGSSAGKVLVGLTSSDTAAGLTGVLDCELDPSAGHGTMPASLLGKLPKSKIAALSVSVVNKTSVEVGGYTIELVATAIAAAQGHPATVNVVLE